MVPEDAYDLLEAIALISNTGSKLKKSKTVPEQKKQVIKKPQIDFFKCGLKNAMNLFMWRTLPCALRFTIHTRFFLIMN